MQMSSWARLFIQQPETVHNSFHGNRQATNERTNEIRVVSFHLPFCFRLCKWQDFCLSFVNSTNRATINVLPHPHQPAYLTSMPSPISWLPHCTPTPTWRGLSSWKRLRIGKPWILKCFSLLYIYIYLLLTLTLHPTPSYYLPWSFIYTHAYRCLCICMYLCTCTGI